MQINRQEGAPQRLRNIDTRVIPIQQLNITGTSSGAAETAYTVPDDYVAEVIAFSVTNKTGTAATLTLHAVPDGDSIGDANKVLDAYSVAANTALSPLELLGGVYGPGTTIQVYSGTNGALNIRGGVRAYR